MSSLFKVFRIWVDRLMQPAPPDLNGHRVTQRVQHRCGRFLAELRGGIVYVACVRCKDLVAIRVDQPSAELRVKEQFVTT